MKSRLLSANFRCECGNRDCGVRFLLSETQWSEVRSRPDRFAVAPQHVAHDVEVVVKEYPDFWMVEKQGDAEKIAEELDRRLPSNSSSSSMSLIGEDHLNPVLMCRSSGEVSIPDFVPSRRLAVMPAQLTERSAARSVVTAPAADRRPPFPRRREPSEPLDKPTGGRELGGLLFFFGVVGCVGRPRCTCASVSATLTGSIRWVPMIRSSSRKA